MRVGIFGGTFDPVHFGHLLLAELCREACELDEVWFVPASAPPHKRHRPIASDDHRTEMLRLGTGGNRAFQISLVELERGGISYTVDTLRQIHESHPETELFLLLGGDSWDDLPQWREPDEICRLASPVVVGRPDAESRQLEGLQRSVGSGLPAPRIVPMPMVEFSSSAIRRRVAGGKSIRYWLPAAVEQFIISQDLYRK